MHAHYILCKTQNQDFMKGGGRPWQESIIDPALECYTGLIARYGSRLNSAAFLVCSVTEGAWMGQLAH